MSFEQLKEYFRESESYKEEEKVIIFMRVGGFYEAYYCPQGRGSGKRVSEVLHIHLTCKKPAEEWTEKNPKFAGFPAGALEKYLTRLNDLNYTVKIYEQDENDKKKRYLKGTYTKNIRMDFESIYDSPENSFVFSYLLEKYPIQKGPNVRYNEYKQHICWYDSNVGKVYFSEMIDNSYYRMLEQFLIQYNPLEMIFYVDNFEEEEKEQIRIILNENGCSHVRVQNWSGVDFKKIEEKMERCFLQKPSLEYYPYMMQNVYYLLEYIENHNPEYSKNIIIPEDCWVQMEDTPFVHFNRDVFRELFLFSVDEERKSGGVGNIKSIYDMLSLGMNTMGRRLLYKILQHPLTSVKEIKERYRKIEESSLSKGIFSNIIDIEHYLLRWRRRTLKENYISSIFFTYKKLEQYYPELKELNDYISSIWDLDKMNSGEMFFKNPSDEYKEWKETYDSYYKKLKDLEEKESELTLYFDKDILGSYYQITNHRWNKWGKVKQEKYRVCANTTSYKKIMYEEYNNDLFKMNSLKEKMIRYERNLLEENTKYILDHFGLFMEEINQKISNDSLYSVLKSFFQKNGYICPDILEGDEFSLEVKNIRHSLIEYLNPNEIFVPFSYRMDSQYSGSLIYGMNSSGKSTFMKSITLGLWFAQCGLWVSAESFSFTPVHSIFTKFSHLDNLFKQQSLFVSEISELKYILDRMTKKSFLCLDELTSGTEIFSSSSLIISLIEYFTKKNIPFLFTTHIHLISEYIENHLKDRIKLYHFEVNESKCRKDNLLLTMNKSDFYNRSLKDGSGRSQYGIEVAEQLGIPTTIIERSYEIRKYIRCEYIEEKEKRSRYNKKLEVKECFKCSSRENLHTHHIFPQENFKEDNILGDGFRKNALYNLLVLCNVCHEDLHHP